MKLLIKIFIYRYFNRHFQFKYGLVFFTLLFQKTVFSRRNMITRKLASECRNMALNPFDFFSIPLILSSEK